MCNGSLGGVGSGASTAKPLCTGVGVVAGGKVLDAKESSAASGQVDICDEESVVVSTNECEESLN